MVYGADPAPVAELAAFKTSGLVLSPDCLLRSPGSSITEAESLGRKEEKHHKIVKNPPENESKRDEQKSHLGERVLGSGNDFTERHALLMESDV